MCIERNSQLSKDTTSNDKHDNAGQILMYIQAYMRKVLNDEKMILSLTRSCIADIGRLRHDKNFVNIRLSCKQGVLGLKTHLTNSLYNARCIIRKEIKHYVFTGSDKFSFSTCAVSVLVAQMICDLAKERYGVDLIYDNEFIGITEEDTHSKKYDNAFNEFAGDFLG